MWRPVVGYEKYYEVSDSGEVRGVARRVKMKSKNGVWSSRQVAAAPLTPHQINSGYLAVHLCAEGKRTPRTVHSLVAEAFFGPRPGGYEVAHWNGKKQDNRAANLRYATRTSNHSDKRRHGTNACGSRIAGAKLTEAQIPAIRALEGRRTLLSAAKEFGVSSMTVQRIWRRETWRHV